MSSFDMAFDEYLEYNTKLFIYVYYMVINEFRNDESNHPFIIFNYATEFATDTLVPYVIGACAKIFVFFKLFKGSPFQPW